MEARREGVPPATAACYSSHFITLSICLIGRSAGGSSVLVEARGEGVPPATAACYSSGLRSRLTPRAGVLQASRPADTGDSSSCFMHSRGDCCPLQQMQLTDEGRLCLAALTPKQHVLGPVTYKRAVPLMISGLLSSVQAMASGNRRQPRT